MVIMCMKDFAADIYTEIFPHLMWFLAVPILIATLLYGLAVHDSRKAGEMYMNVIRIISAPVVYSITAPLRDLPNKIQNIAHPQP